MLKFTKKIFGAIAKAFNNPCWDCEGDCPGCYENNPKCPRRNDEEGNDAKDICTERCSRQ